MRRVWVVLIGSLIAVMRPSMASAQWTVKSLHPVWAHMSRAYGVCAEQVLGVAERSYPEGTWSAVLWNETSGQCVDLNPENSVVSFGWDLAASQQVGNFRPSGGYVRASLWTGSAESWIDLHPVGPLDHSSAFGTDGIQQVGVVTVDGVPLASMWSGSAASWVNLNPPGVNGGFAQAVQYGQQVGGVLLADGTEHASLWTGSAESWVDLHPHELSGGSRAFSINEGQQVGYVFPVNGRTRAILWSGTPESWVDLTPPGATESRAFKVSHGVQFGTATFCGEDRPVIWYGTAESWEDLSLSLPSGYDSAVATAMWSDGVTIRVAGYATNSMPSRVEAMLWTRSYGSRCPADLDFNGFVNGDDFDYFAGAFESGDAAADFNRDCFVNGDDFDAFAEHFEAGC